MKQKTYINMNQEEILNAIKASSKKIKRKVYAYLVYNLYQKKNNKIRMQKYRLMKKMKDAKLNK